MLLLSYSACNAQFQRSCGSENYPHSLTFFTVTFPFTQYLQAKQSLSHEIRNVVH